ncbi:hypothetical protein DRE_07498 [Drechslerella stenobrocha 248]|uniref:Rhodopsin domain-containing protein n=1 Tax=Drechslerella stenobrocha 248 TaxID=1043628 RepID=W7HUH6_9PEZI|nr:hypothetical protein DRE_07498 [Drechslerella stenobrocha 248]
MSSNMTLTPDDEQTLNTACFYLSGTSAEQWWNRPAKDVIFALSELIVKTPEPTEADLIRVTGWSQENFEFMDANFAPWNETMPYFQAQLEVISHPKSTLSIIPIFVVFTIFTSIVMGLRIWSRLSILGRIQSFDWMAIVSYILIVGWCALSVVEKTVSGEWASYCDRSYIQASNAFRAYYLGMAFYPLAILSVKFALLLFYYSLSTWQPMRWAVYFTAFASFANSMVAMFMWIWQCNFPDLWNHLVDQNVTCTAFRPYDLVLGTGAVNILTDVIIWLIPLPLVWRLQLYPRERIMAVFTFGLGAIAWIASVVRLVYVARDIVYTNGSTTNINAWAMVELNLGLICSSAPALRALLIKHSPKVLSYGYPRAGSSGSDVASKAGRAEKTFVISQSEERSPSPDEKV